MSKTEEKKVEAEEQAEETTEVQNDRYIGVVQNRSRNLMKRYKNAIELESRPQSELLPNQREAIRQKEACKFAAEEMDKLVPAFEQIRDETTKTADAEQKLNRSIFSTILLLPVYLAEDKELRMSAILSKQKSLTAESIEALCSLRDYIIPTTIGTPLHQAIGNSADMLKHLEEGSTEQSPLGPTYAELRATLSTLVTSDALVTLPKQPKKAQKEKKAPRKAKQAKNEKPAAAAAEAEAPAPVPASAPAPAKTSEPPKQKKEKKPKQKNDVYKPAEKPAAADAPAPVAAEPTPAPAAAAPPKKEENTQASQFHWTPGKK